MGGWVLAISKSGTTGLFKKSYIHLTFRTGPDIVEFTTEAHIPVDVERIYTQVTQIKENK